MGCHWHVSLAEGTTVGWTHVYFCYLRPSPHPTPPLDFLISIGQTCLKCSRPFPFSSPWQLDTNFATKKKTTNRIIGLVHRDPYSGLL